MLEQAETELELIRKSKRKASLKKPLLEWYSGHISGLKNGIDQLSQAVQKAKEEERESLLDTIIELSSKYWIDRNVGAKPPLVVNKHQFKRFVLYELQKET